MAIMSSPPRLLPEQAVQTQSELHTLVLERPAALLIVRLLHVLHVPCCMAGATDQLWQVVAVIIVFSSTFQEVAQLALCPSMEGRACGLCHAASSALVGRTSAAHTLQQQSSPLALRPGMGMSGLPVPTALAPDPGFLLPAS